MALLCVPRLIRAVEAGADNEKNLMVASGSGSTVGVEVAGNDTDSYNRHGPFKKMST